MPAGRPLIAHIAGSVGAQAACSGWRSDGCSRRDARLRRPLTWGLDARRRYLDHLGMASGHLDLLLLAVLRRGGPQHGYAVIAGLRDASAGEFDLPEGTVYPALHKLERDGLVQSEWSVEEGRKRRVYALTGAGRTALSVRKKEWSMFRSGVESVLA